MKLHEIMTATRIRAASLAMMVITLSGMESSWAASPEAQPAEPEQLRGLPRPNELPLAQGPFQPTQASLDELYRCPEWFADAKFGFWAHWGPQSVGENGWYAKRMYDPSQPQYQNHIRRFGHPSKVGYKDILPLFTADKFDPEGLMAEFKQMGARLFMAMGVHHDNYDMWDSKYHRWNATKIGPHKDIVALWQQAAKDQSIRFGVSEHLAPSFDFSNNNKQSDKTGPFAGVPYDGMDPAYWDLYHPPHPRMNVLNAGFTREDIAKAPEWFKEHWYRRMYDLITTYQPDFVDSDDFGLPWGDEYASKLVAHYYNRSAAAHGGSPDVVWLGREGNGKGVLSYSEFNLPRLAWRYPWAQGTAMSSWFWGGANNKAPEVLTLVEHMVEVICRNGNYIIAFPQLPDGTVPEDHMVCLRELGKWVRLNEEGIFGTRPWRVLGEGPTTRLHKRKKSDEPYTKEDIRFTRKKDVVYAFLMNPSEEKVVIRSLGKQARLADGVPQSVRLLGHDGKLIWSQEEDGLKVQLPQEWVGRMVPVIEIRGLAAWDGDIRPGLDGQLVLEANDACLNGRKLKHLFRREFIENWNDPAEWVSWDKVHLLEAGEYEVTIYGGGLRAEAPYRLTLGDKELTGIAPAAGGWGKGQVFPAGKIVIEKAGVYPVALRAGTNESWGGLQIFNVTLKQVK